MSFKPDRYRIFEANVNIGVKKNPNNDNMADNYFF